MKGEELEGGREKFRHIMKGREQYEREGKCGKGGEKLRKKEGCFFYNTLTGKIWLSRQGLSGDQFTGSDSSFSTSGAVKQCHQAGTYLSLENYSIGLKPFNIQTSSINNINASFGSCALPQ